MVWVEVVVEERVVVDWVERVVVVWEDVSADVSVR